MSILTGALTVLPLRVTYCPSSVGVEFTPTDRAASGGWMMGWTVSWAGWAEWAVPNRGLLLGLGWLGCIIGDPCSTSGENLWTWFLLRSNLTCLGEPWGICRIWDRLRRSRLPLGVDTVIRPGNSFNLIQYHSWIPFQCSGVLNGHTFSMDQTG